MQNKREFWAVYMSGMEWPELFAAEKPARERADSKARGHVGSDVHLMKVESIGTVNYPDQPKLTGALSNKTGVGNQGGREAGDGQGASGATRTG